MMAVPLIVGLAMRPQPALHPYLQAGCFVVGYFAFHAASQWLKSTPRRRARYQAALATYLSGSAILGLGALAVVVPSTAAITTTAGDRLAIAGLALGIG